MAVAKQKAAAVSFDAGAALAALRSVSTALRDTIGELTGKISQTEQQVRSNLAQAKVAAEQITARKREIEQGQQTKRTIGLLGALLGAPIVAVVSLVQVTDDDARIQTLRADQARLDREHAKLVARIATYRESRTALMRQVDVLAELATPLEAMLNSHDTGERAPLAQARARYLAGEQLVGNLRSQVALLRSVEQAVAPLGVAVQAHLADAQAALLHAEKLVDDSRKALVEIIKIAISKRPEVAARKWLSNRLVSEVAKRLTEAGLTGEAGKEVAKLLAKRLVEGTPKQVDDFANAVNTELDQVGRVVAGVDRT